MNQDTVTATEAKKPLHLILKQSARLLLISEDNITDTSNTSQRATEARYMIFWLMEQAGYTHQQIATFFKADRTTVCRGLAKLDVWREAYADVRHTCMRLENLALNTL